MSAFDAMVEDGLAPAIRAVFGVTVSYAATAGGSTTDVAAQSFAYLPVERREDDSADTIGERARCLIAVSELASPAVGGEITYDGQTWTIETAEKMPGSHNRLNLVRSVSARWGREGHRLKR